MNRVGSVMIVGGGSSGWMAAAYLSRLCPDLKITLVESPTIQVIGVGEATVPFINTFLETIGFNDPQIWMPECDATYKTGILFENWNKRGDRYWHPFDRLDYVDPAHHTGHCWYTWRQAGELAYQRPSSFYEAFFMSTTLNAEELKYPSFREFAYHFDAFQFGELLRAASPRVRHVIDNVVDVIVDPSGNIESIQTAENGALQADLYLDCTGFRRMLISRVAPSGRFTSYASSLFCDRAVVIRIPYGPGENKERILHPYVKSSAQTAGWIWSIPLYSKMSSGYVYSSQFLSEEEAELELRRYWSSYRNVDELDCLRIRFETGKLVNTWVGNCIAIGLAGGFIEPLESTGLAITQMGIEIATSMMDARFYDHVTQERYNLYITKFYADIYHFVVAHYCLTDREDTPFWATVKHETNIPDELQQRLEVFKWNLPTTGTRGTAEPFMFRDISWFAVLLGMGFGFSPQPVEAHLSTAGRLILERKRATIRGLQAKLPNHYRFLRDSVYGHE
jgi:hypothetical protein